MNKKWINFEELRKQLSFADVLASYNVTLVPKGTTGQYVGTCPLPSHENAKGQTFSANFEKGVWQCFGCKESGNVIDLAVLMERKNKKNGNDVREVAMSLRDRFVAKTPPAGSPPPTSPPASREASAEVVVNQPLDFELKTLDTAHPYFAAHKLTADTIDRFGLGFCKRGLLAGRIAVPLVDDEAQLVGYTGLAVEKLQTGVPRYLYPGPREHDGVTHVFDAGKFLYNGFRIGRAVKDLIVVRDPHTVWHLLQGGFANVVALMSDECSADQATMLPLLTADTARIWLLTDSGPESEQCAMSLLPQVASSRLCRWVKVKKEEEMVPDHPLLAVLPRR